MDDDALPSSSLADWVSYASHLSVVTVVNEVELPLPEGLSEEEAGGYVGRSVDLRIDETLWSSPGTDVPTGTISAVVNGWIRKNGVSIPYGSLGAHRLEVGNTYIIPLVEYEGGWGWLSASTVLPVGTDWRVDIDLEWITNPASQLFHGKSFSEVTRTLGSTTPDPVAASFAHLPAIERYSETVRFEKLRETVPDLVE